MASSDVDMTTQGVENASWAVVEAAQTLQVESINRSLAAKLGSRTPTVECTGSKHSAKFEDYSSTKFGSMEMRFMYADLEVCLSR